MARNFPVPLYCTNQTTPAPPFTADHRRLSSTSPGSTDSVLTVIQGNLAAGALFLRPEQSLAVSTNNAPPAGVDPLYGWIMVPTTEFNATTVRLLSGTFTVPIHFTRNGGILTANFGATHSVYMARLSSDGTTVLQDLGMTTGAAVTVTEAEQSQSLNISTAAATFETGEQLMLAVYVQKASAALTEYRMQTNSTTGTRVTAAPQYSLDFVRALGDTLTLSDAIARAYSGARTLTDTTTLTDALMRQVAAARTLADNSAVSDAITRQFTGARSLSDTTPLSEAITRQFSGARTLTDSTSLTDTLTRVASFPRALTDTTPLADAITRQFVANRSLTDNLTPLSDALTRQFTGARTLSDGTAVTDTLTRQALYARSLLEEFREGGGGDVTNVYPTFQIIE